jgi:60 kDa SS-A/Ro ribonucleoprotein
MTNYAQHLRPPTQREPLPGMVMNDAGGAAYAVSDRTLLDRFLILGAEGGTYYAGEATLTREAAAATARCLAADPADTLARVIEISASGRALKNDPALFVLALALASADVKTRALAYAALPHVARIGTHLFTLLGFCKALGRGWSRGLKRAVAAWYDRPDLAYQVVKYQQRNGWSHRDVLRLAHVAPTETNGPVLRYAAGKADAPTGDALIEAVRRLHEPGVSDDEAYTLISEYRIPREAIPSAMLARNVIWHAMLDAGMPVMAMVRNLGTMSKLGVLVPGDEPTVKVCATLTNPAVLRKARVHPAALLLALETYRAGHGTKSDATWPVVPQVLDALSEGFHAAFATIEPSNQRILCGVDESGSMSATVFGSTMSCSCAAAAMALVTVASEPKASVVAFDTQARGVAVSGKQRLDDVVRLFEHGGGTDCSAPINYATALGLSIDLFVLYTDEQTWAGPRHVMQALRDYRRKVNPQAKLACVAMAVNRVTVIDENDAGTLACAGFDATTPQAVSAFGAGL